MTPASARLLSLLALAAPVLSTLAGWWLGPAALSHWMQIAPGVKLALLLLAPAALLAGSGRTRAARPFAALALLFAILMLAAAALAAWRGLPRGPSLLDVMRPTTFTSFGVALLAASLLWRVPLSTRADLSMLTGIGACAVFFLLLLAHLFGATVLSAGTAARYIVASGLGTTALFAVAMAALAAHEANPMLAYLGDDTGAVAKRRLLPAAVLMPVSTGFLLLFAIEDRGLTPGFAVALTVFANVLAMLLLIDGAGNRVSEVVLEKEERWQARTAAARRQGTRDALTGLLNRRGWDLALDAAHRQCQAENLEAGVLMIDLDGLKQINDSKGHAAGDALIRATAEALKTAARRSDALARLGGDEFAYLAVGCDAQRASALVQRFEQALARAGVEASVGQALSVQGAVAAAVERADRAMYQRKRARSKQRRA